MKLIWQRIIDTTSANPFILWICSQISTRKVEIDILTGETQVNSFDLVYVSWMGTEKSKNNMLELIILKDEIIPFEIHLTDVGTVHQELCHSIQLLEVWWLEDSGKSLNPAVDIGQIEAKETCRL